MSIIPSWTKPAFFGAAVGAVALAIAGFSAFGWTTAGAAADLAKKGANDAIIQALTPYCVERSKSDANSVTVLAELEGASSFNRRGIVEKAGWATPLGADSPNRDLAQACQLALMPA